MITKPTLLLDEAKCKANIIKMASKAQASNIDFRPHFKTHQSLEIGNWIKVLGVNKITVSSVTMAEYFSSDWDDITIAFPVNILEMDRINALAERITLNVLAESEDSIRYLTKHVQFELNVFIKIDVGTHRTGIDPSNLSLINAILEVMKANHLLHFAGFLGHAGHTYQSRDKAGVQAIHSQSLDIMHKLKDKFGTDYPNLIVSLGDTPGCSVAEDFAGVDEIRPGNFVFYDLTQYLIGSNTISQIAVAMACPIVAIHSERSELVVYGGGVHLSKEHITDEEGKIYGRIVEKKNGKWGNVISQMYVKSLSQEHGIISAPNHLIEQYRVGEYLLILPVHSCMTANLMRSYTTCTGRIIPKL